MFKETYARRFVVLASEGDYKSFLWPQALARLLCTNVALLGSAPVRCNHWTVFLICLPWSELQPVIKGLRKLLLIIVMFWMQAWPAASMPSYLASMLTLQLVKLSESTPCGIVYTWKLVGLISFSTAFCSHCGEKLLWQPYAIERLTYDIHTRSRALSYLLYCF